MGDQATDSKPANTPGTTPGGIGTGNNGFSSKASAATAEAARYVYGPRPIGALVPAITRPAFKKRSPAGAQVMADWPSIVGPDLSAVTVPRRLIGGTLTLACSGPMAMELQHMSGQVIERVNSHLGRVLVERLRFVQDPTPPAAPLPPPRRRPAAVVAVPGIAPGPLRDALSALGQVVAGQRDAGA